MRSTKFVILHHTPRQGENNQLDADTHQRVTNFEPHWDFMIQQGEVLTTWQLYRDPTSHDTVWPIRAVRIQDHRLHYLTYEGEISHGRGWVRRVAEGMLTIMTSDSNRLSLDCHSPQLTGRFDLVAVPQERTSEEETKRQANPNLNEWTFAKA
ncbi:MAG: DNA polymerase ligase N-terminal domain-containing protein [Phycisphaerae bacterium]